MPTELSRNSEICQKNMPKVVCRFISFKVLRKYGPKNIFVFPSSVFQFLLKILWLMYRQEVQSTLVF